MVYYPAAAAFACLLGWVHDVLELHFDQPSPIVLPNSYWDEELAAFDPPLVSQIKQAIAKKKKKSY